MMTAEEIWDKAGEMAAAKDKEIVDAAVKDGFTDGIALWNSVEKLRKFLDIMGLKDGIKTERHYMAQVKDSGGSIVTWSASSREQIIESAQEYDYTIIGEIEERDVPL
jgi:hypothetical protein